MLTATPVVRDVRDVRDKSMQSLNTVDEWSSTQLQISLMVSLSRGTPSAFWEAPLPTDCCSPSQTCQHPY